MDRRHVERGPVLHDQVASGFQHDVQFHEQSYALVLRPDDKPAIEKFYYDPRNIGFIWSS
ncbi:hypothetical protein [Polymorphobacter sp.]|uniref:hypothetical protein n=1 Tax=Polymorphobacter sp. TaxID=1909290 RepID=UPI003F7208A4